MDFLSLHVVAAIDKIKTNGNTEYNFIDKVLKSKMTYRMSLVNELFQ